MKKVLKTLFPVLLVIAIVGMLIWYTFVYDRGFTRDLLLGGARLFSDNGNQSLSSMFYDWAYRHSGQDENVAIELADQYKAAGNYTKAEYTLSGAIADGGTSELYIALCKTYVEQDKLLDAVTMLDNIGDPAIKEELAAQRPVIKTISPTPGFYSQYISVTLEASEGVIYYSTSEYPSIAGTTYTEPLALPNGETTIYAVAVSDSGLVSPLSLLGYTIGGVIEEVTLEDAAIEAEVRRILSLREDEPIYTDDLWEITQFTVPKDAASLADLAKMNYLTTLNASGVKIDSLQSLSSLTLLQSVNLSGSRFPAGDLAVLGSLPDLKTLDLSGCGLSTIAGLEGAKNLTTLYLNNNTLRNLTPLSGLTMLKELYLQHNAIIDLSALNALTELQTLDASYNSITSLGNITALQKLTKLDLSYNQLSSLAGMDQLTNLSYLSLSSNALENIDVLAGCVNLTELHIARNKILSIDSLKSLARLKTLNFSHNTVSALPAWGKDCALYSIDGSYNQLTTLSALEGMENLAYVYMDYNSLTSIQPLEKCHKLVQVNVYGNQISSVSGLTSQSVIVNFDPSV
ncbi:MAG: leucine-rich repeat domain-containing protein [Oscillospiraceae bacterium]|nr:leucine-rich repeat domain-containing protein [Oscillospiraceae bacterium]